MSVQRKGTLTSSRQVSSAYLLLAGVVLPLPSALAHVFPPVFFDERIVAYFRSSNVRFPVKQYKGTLTPLIPLIPMVRSLQHAANYTA